MKLTVSNEERATRAENALTFYEDVPEANVTDLLADLRHYCDRAGIDFDGAVQDSEMHHAAEKQEG